MQNERYMKKRTLTNIRKSYIIKPTKDVEVETINLLSLVGMETENPFPLQRQL